MIKIYDDFFPEEIQKEVYERLMKPHWHLRGGDPNNLFWHYDGLENEEYFTGFLYQKICNSLDRNFKSIESIYANGQTARQCGTPHQDDTDVTFLYYPVSCWDVKLQGHLIFLDENEEGQRIIMHKPNRAILFPGELWHYADAPVSFFNGLRISLAYKFLT